jgi:hypothetical protein
MLVDTYCQNIFLYNICVSLGSLPSSHRQIEPELLRIIMQNWRLNDLLFAQSDNTKLIEGLKLIQPRPTSGSLAAYDEYEFAELRRFRRIYRLEVECTITGAESLPGEMMTPNKNDVSLPDDMYTLLVEYYNAAYDKFNFITIANAAQNPGHTGRTVVRPQINQYGRIRIGAEVFGSAIAPRYLKNSFILAKFIQENGSIETFPGQVQYFFEHKVDLSKKTKRHRLAFVRWFTPVPTHKVRFHFQVNDDVQSCNVEIWSTNFYDISRDCIIPVHNILGRFIPCSYKIGRRQDEYMAAIPIGRKFHM